MAILAFIRFRWACDVLLESSSSYGMHYIYLWSHKHIDWLQTLAIAHRLCLWPSNCAQVCCCLIVCERAYNRNSRLASVCMVLVPHNAINKQQIYKCNVTKNSWYDQYNIRMRINYAQSVFMKMTCGSEKLLTKETAISNWSSWFLFVRGTPLAEYCGRWPLTNLQRICNEFKRIVKCIYADIWKNCLSTGSTLLVNCCNNIKRVFQFNIPIKDECSNYTAIRLGYDRELFSIFPHFLNNNQISNAMRHVYNWMMCVFDWIPANMAKQESKIRPARVSKTIWW